jgi:hypothetical protein
MTPAQQKYDQDLARSMRNISQQLAPRSRKLSDIFQLAAERLEALSSAVPIDPPPAPSPPPPHVSSRAVQPASTPDRAKRA